MRYKCPSCFVRWSDIHDDDPFDRDHHQLCRECGRGIDREGLIKKQMSQLSLMSQADAIRAIGYGFTYLKERIDERIEEK